MSGFASLLRAHGANPEKLYAALGIPMPWTVTDFSTNASVVDCEWPDISLPDLASHYPDDGCSELCGIIAEREGVPESSVLFANGSNEALYLVASCLGAKRAAILNPAYTEYARALLSCGADVTDIFDLSDVGRFDAVFLSNPCNPTGEYISGLPDAARKNPETLFVVDEAYIDFLLDGERDVWGVRPNVILLRSLTKFYRMSGVRAGYAVAPREWIERMKARQPTWSVNAVAQTLAAAFLRDDDFARRSLEFYRRETPLFIRGIENAGFSVRPSRVHFFLMNVCDDERIITGLMRRGVVVRHTRNFRGLDGRAPAGMKCVRIATRSHADNARLISALREMRKEGVF